MRALSVLALATLLVLGIIVTGQTACAKAPPNLTPAQKTAFYAYKALSLANESARQVVVLESNKVITTDAAVNYMKVVYAVNVEGEKLAKLLEEYDALTSPSAKLTLQTKVDAALVLFEHAVQELAGVNIGPATSEASKTVQLVLQTVATLRSLVDSLKTAQILAPIYFHSQPVAIG